MDFVKNIGNKNDSLKNNYYYYNCIDLKMICYQMSKIEKCLHEIQKCWNNYVDGCVHTFLFSQADLEPRKCG